MRRAVAPVAALALAGCGGGAAADPDYSLTTPPERVGARPVSTAEPLRARKERDMTARDARRLRPVLAAWADALRASDSERAAALFLPPAIIAQNGRFTELRSVADLEAFHAALPCGARLEEVQQDGRYIVGTFRLTARPGIACANVGELVRVGFVFRGRRISEWHQVPDTPGAEPGPARRPEVPAGSGAP